jgi:hypothetical protein
MEAHDDERSFHDAPADGVRERTRGRLADRGLDPDRVIGETDDGSAIDLATFYDILGAIAASEKAGQSPTYALARLALRSELPCEVSDSLFLAYNQQSAEEAGHGDKVFANAYFAMGALAPIDMHSVFGAGDDLARGLEPSDDFGENERLLANTAARTGGIEMVALQRVFPLITTLCERWEHPIGRDLAMQIRDVVRPEESRHVLTWRYVFHRLIAPKGPAAVDEYMQMTNAGRIQVGGPSLDREAFERMLGTHAPTTRQLLGKERALHA